MPLDQDVIRFVVGSINRERQRVAAHLRKAGVDETIVGGILDASEDTNVFRDNGADVKLNDPYTMRDTGRDDPKG